MLPVILMLLALVPFAAKDDVAKEVPMRRVEDPTDQAFLKWTALNQLTLEDHGDSFSWTPCAPETVWIHLRTTREYLENIPVETTDTTWVIRSSDGR